MENSNPIIKTLYTKPDSNGKDITNSTEPSSYSDGDNYLKNSLKRDRNVGSEYEEEDDEKNKNRGNYRCSKCMLPKKGHICPYQQKIRRRDSSNAESLAYRSNTVEVQVELNSTMTVRLLDLSKQGYPESYLLP